MSSREQRERVRSAGDRVEPRPEPDEAPLEDPGPADLTFRDYRAATIRAIKSFLGDNGTMLASALAYSTFFAIPSVLLVAVGLFTLVAGPGTITALMQHFQAVMPAQATSLLGQSLHRLDARPSTSLAMTIVGAVLALWSLTGAMGGYMTAVNIAHDREDSRSFFTKRLVALTMVAAIGIAFLLVAVLLMFGPQVEKLIAAHAGPVAPAVGWIWWIAQWPILLVGLLAAFAVLLHLAPDKKPRKWEFLTPGSAFAVIVWLAASGLFAVYTGMFGSYDKTWGSLSAVIVMLTWLWLAAIALLLGAEINAEVERSRALRTREAAG